MTVKVTPYIVKMELSLEDFGKHVHEANDEFKENILKKVNSIKSKDTNDLGKKVEELKAMEASELAKLNKGYFEADLKAKKVDRKVSFICIVIFEFRTRDMLALFCLGLISGDKRDKRDY